MIPEADEPRDTKTREPTLQFQPRPEKNLKYNTHLRIRCRHVQSHARNLFVKRKSETSLQPSCSATTEKMPEPITKLEKSLKRSEEVSIWYELIKPSKCPAQDIYHSSHYLKIYWNICLEKFPLIYNSRWAQ